MLITMPQWLLMFFSEKVFIPVAILGIIFYGLIILILECFLFESTDRFVKSIFYAWLLNWPMGSLLLIIGPALDITWMKLVFMWIVGVLALLYFAVLNRKAIHKYRGGTDEDDYYI